MYSAKINQDEDDFYEYVVRSTYFCSLVYTLIQIIKCIDIKNNFINNCDINDTSMIPSIIA